MLWNPGEWKPCGSGNPGQYRSAGITGLFSYCTAASPVILSGRRLTEFCLTEHCMGQQALDRRSHRTLHCYCCHLQGTVEERRQALDRRLHRTLHCYCCHLQGTVEESNDLFVSSSWTTVTMRIKTMECTPPPPPKKKKRANKQTNNTQTNKHHHEQNPQQLSNYLNEMFFLKFCSVPHLTRFNGIDWKSILNNVSKANKSTITTDSSNLTFTFQRLIIYTRLKYLRMHNVMAWTRSVCLFLCLF